MYPFFDIHTHTLRQDTAVKKIYNYPKLDNPDFGLGDQWVSLGIHPWDLQAETWQEDMHRLQKQVLNPTVKMIGECGLDRLKGPALPLQKEVFQLQADLAVETGKPLIIHCVKAFDVLMPFGKVYRSKIPMIIHGFNKSPELGKQLIEHGFLLSFGASILKDTGSAALLSILDTPFFLETDNSASPIETIYERAAFLRQVSVNTLKDTIFANWQKISGPHEHERY